MFGNALSTLGKRRQQSRQAALSTRQMELKIGKREKQRQREREQAEKERDGGAERSWDKIFNIHLFGYREAPFEANKVNYWTQNGCICL